MKNKTLIEEMNDEIEREIAAEFIGRKASIFLMAKIEEEEKEDRDEVLIQYLDEMYTAFWNLKRKILYISDDSLRRILKRDQIFFGDEIK